MGNDIQRRIVILALVIIAALVFLYPTIGIVYKKYTNAEITADEQIGGSWISKPLALGLDLSGGVHLTYEVQSAEAVTARLQADANALRSELRNEKIAVVKTSVSASDEIEIALLSDRYIEKAKKIIEEGRRLVFRRADQKDGRATLVYGITDQEVSSIKDFSVSQAVETLRARIDQFGVTEPLIQRIGAQRINLQMPGVKDIEAVKNVVGKVAKLEFRFLPRATSGAGSTVLKDDQGASITVEDTVQLTGAAVADARVGFLDGKVEVALTLTSEGGRQFAKLTGENVGARLAIILDGVVHSSPVINERISGGRCSITGGFSMDEAKQLAVVLRAGALPAPLKIMEEKTVGPTLGAESIRRGVTAMLIGFAAIILFMAVYYKKAGWLASATLFLNIILVLAILSAFGATLTLPGLAGLALTVGMAVDSNVIIYERIKEELRIGAGRDAAVDAGFSKAMSAILDSNITTLLAAAILYFLGSGPIKGFAVTLAAGIITTIFCATFVSRFLFDALPLKGKNTLSI